MLKEVADIIDGAALHREQNAPLPGDGLECLICFQGVQSWTEGATEEDMAFTLQCGHTFHRVCIRRALIAAKQARDEGVRRGDDGLRRIACPTCRVDAEVMCEQLTQVADDARRAGDVAGTAEAESDGGSIAAHAEGGGSSARPERAGEVLCEQRTQVAGDSRQEADDRRCAGDVIGEAGVEHDGESSGARPEHESELALVCASGRGDCSHDIPAAQLAQAHHDDADGIPDSSTPEGMFSDHGSQQPPQERKLVSAAFGINFASADMHAAAREVDLVSPELDLVRGARDATEFLEAVWPKDLFEGMTDLDKLYNGIRGTLDAMHVDTRSHRQISEDSHFATSKLVPRPCHVAARQLALKNGMHTESFLLPMASNITWLEHHWTRFGADAPAAGVDVVAESAGLAHRSVALVLAYSGGGGAGRSAIVSSGSGSISSTNVQQQSWLESRVGCVYRCRRQSVLLVACSRSKDVDKPETP